MSKGGGKQTTTQTQTQSVDPEFKARALDVYSRAQTAADRPYQAYTGELVAGFTPQQQQAFGMFGTAAGAGQPAVSQAQALAGQVGAAQPQTVAEAMQAYQNPYTQQVIDTALGDIERSRLMAQEQNAAQAIRAKAFGGSRQGVVEAETNRAALEQAAKTAAGLRASGFETAAGLGARDIAATQQAEAQRLAAAGTLGQLGGAEQAMALRGAEALFGAGGAQQQLEQARLEDAYKRFAEERGYPLEQLNILQQALGFFPNPITTTGTTTQRQTLGPMDIISRIGGTAAQGATAYALLCWVARTVYGVENPRWLMFRHWVITDAPKWFLQLYIRHGEKFAAWISDKPSLKNAIRAFMDRKIHKKFGGSHV
jgi:hypothetical protein